MKTKGVIAGLLLLVAGLHQAWAQEAYVALSDDGQTATFYYDTQKQSRTGVVEINHGETPGGQPPAYGNAQTVVIDESFAAYRPTSTTYWFYNCSMTSIIGMENLCTDEVTNMTRMFNYCTQLTSLDLRYFNTANVTRMLGMFFGCQSLTSLDLSSFNTVNVKDMSYLFFECNEITSIDVSTLNTTNVTDMSFMFYDCFKLTSLDLCSFNTANVKSMMEMFYHDRELKTIYADEEKWSTASLTGGTSNRMFDRCTQLVGGNGTAYDEEHTNSEYARIDKPGQPGYFTAIPAYDIWITGKQITGKNEGDVLGDGTVRYDPDTKTLTLSNATIQGSGTVTGLPEERGTGLYIGEPGVTVDVEGLNTITGAADCEALWFPSSAKNSAITGNGVLTLNSDYTSLYLAGDTLTICDNVTIEANCGVVGLYRYRAGHPNWYSTLCMKDNATVKAYRPGAPAIYNLRELLLEDGQTILEPEGAYWDAEEHEPRHADGSRIEGEWMVIANGTPKAVDLVFKTDGENNGLIQENDGQLANVTLEGLTFSRDGTWQTLCLPFDVELDGSPLEGADVRPIGAAQEVEGCLVIDCLTPVTKLEAGCPYIIRWNGGDVIVDPVFSGVTIKATQPQPVFLFDNRWVFIGLYDFHQLDNNESAATHMYYVGGNGVLHNFVGRSNAYAFECYLVANQTPDEWPEPIVMHTDGSIDELLNSLGIGHPVDLVFKTDGENSGLIQENDGKVANVTLEGITFSKAGTWQTICLPFDVELDGSPLEGADVRPIGAAQEVEGCLVIDCLTPVTKLEAGCPYIIRWNGGDVIVDPVFSGVTIKATQPQPVFLFDNSMALSGLYDFYQMDNNNESAATHTYYVGGNGVLHNFVGRSNAYAFECYFVVDPNLNEWPKPIALHTDGSIDELLKSLGIGQGPADLTFWPYGVNSDLIEGNEGREANVTIEDCTFRKDGTWQTICLPFDVELDGSPLEGADARTAEAMQEVEGYLVIDCLTPVTKLEAGCPYIIRWNGGDDIVNPVFSGVTIKAIKPQPVFLSDNKWVFIGLYSFYPMEDDEHASLLYYLGGNGVFHNFAGGGEVYAFQCYLVANQTPDEWPESIVLHTDGSIDDLIDGIGDIKGQTATDDIIYNVAGQRLRKMQKGVNILSGKKVLVK